MKHIQRLHNTGRNLALALVNGYILTFYSEFLFYGQLNDPGSPVPQAADFLWLLAAYTLMAYLVLALILRYRVASLPTLLIVGAAYGWALEGGLVATVYESLPWSLSFTGLAWHMPIDLLFGWYLVQKWLRERDAAFNLRAAALTGLAWGFWAVWPAQVIPLRPAKFTLFALGAIGLLLAAYWLNGHLGLPAFRPHRGGILLAAAIFLFWYFTQTAFSAPLSLFLLPLLLGVCWWALRRNARCQTAPDLFEALAGRPRPRNLLAWLAFPLVAAAEYALWAASGWHIPSNIVGYLITVPLGFGLFFWALWKIGRKQAA